jgi:hypothetical protein
MRVRVALWLHSEVGEGGAFTKAQLRAAFPGVEQIDRRMRDLRPEGWVIATYREDRSLSSAEELRLVTAGGPVWEQGYRPKTATAVTDKERKGVFEADNYACLYCGITGGEAYPDDPLRTAKLTLARVAHAGGGPAQLATACDRCHVATRDEPPSALRLVESAAALTEPQRSRLRGWVRQGIRPQEPEERLWAHYRRAPAVTRRELEEQLRDQ